MFEEVFLYEKDDAKLKAKGATNEDEYYGGPTEKHIYFKSLLDWMDKVGANSNAKFLKCYNWKKNNVAVSNIEDIVFSNNIVHKLGTFANAVKIAFKEDANLPAMTLAKASELFKKIATLCEENGVDLNDVEVFVQDPSGKLTQFSWWYDDEFDTACIIKNMSPRAVSRFMRGGADAVVNAAAKTSKTPDRLIDQLAKIEEQMQKLASRRDAAMKKLEDLPVQA